ncbi:MAG: hypothetical protein IT383_03430 [Deltaproteobacteria bacterium]|nr:hypothetical protein [Deltaproteobacteria bacterium]
MLAPLTLLALLGAPPASVAVTGARRPQAVSVLALDLEAVNVEADTARAVTRLVAAALGELEGLRVTSQEDMRTLANLDAAKQSMDCDAKSCLAELAGALGARAVVFGSVTGLGSTTTLALSLFDSKSGLIARRTIEAKALDDIQPALRPALRELLLDAGLIAPPIAPVPLSPLVLAGGGAAALGGLALLGGGVTTGVCEILLNDAAKPGVEKEPLQLAGRAGLLVAGAGAVIGAVGVLLLLLPEGA